MGTGVPSLRIVAPLAYTGYAGLGTKTLSPGLTKARAMLAIPSFDPMSAITSFAGSRSTLNLPLYQSAMACLNVGSPWLNE